MGRERKLKLLAILLLVIFLYHAEVITKGYIISDASVSSTAILQEADNKQICSTQERITSIQTRCKHQLGTHYTKQNLSAMSKQELVRFVDVIWVDECHKVLFCEIYKGGSTTWMNILANNSCGTFKGTSMKHHVPEAMSKEHNITMLRYYNQSEIMHRLGTYYKFMVVRHPFDRLISGYRDRFVGDPPKYKEIANYIVESYRKFSTNPDNTETNPTFGEFAAFFIDKHMGHNNVYDHLLLDRHFIPSEHQCHPCQIHYDYIGKLETQSQDASYIINEKLSGRGADNLLKLYSHREGAAQGKALPELSELDTEQLDKLKYIFGRDMSLFGYSIPKSNDMYTSQCGLHKDDCC